MSAIDAITTLRHFALVTYAVPPERVRPLIHPRFDLDLVTIDGAPRIVPAPAGVSADRKSTRLNSSHT